MISWKKSVTCLAFALSSAQAITIEGQVFVVTEGRDNLKMGAVTISVYRTADFGLALAAEAARIAPELVELNDQIARCDREIKVAEISLQSTEFLRKRRAELKQATQKKYQDVWRGLRGIVPITKVVTDADGRFKVDISGEKAVFLFGQGERKVGSSREKYVWVEGSEGGQVLLSNQQDSGERIAAGYCLAAYRDLLARRAESAIAEQKASRPPPDRLRVAVPRPTGLAGLRVGMSKAEVSEVLGEPTVRTDTRWYYSGRGWVRFSGEFVAALDERG